LCGIAGVINLDRQPVSADILHLMNQTLAHRGPDGDGFYCDGNVGFAHRRLAIIDPSGGNQPFYNDDQNIILSFNGEVYNYIELQKELEYDFHFRNHSDTEVVLRAYEKWGIAALERFRGMFAFALYDKNHHLLYLVRDRVGIKPLFYYQSFNQLLFASEILPILRAGIPRNILHESLANYLRYQYIPTPATIYEDLHKLEPGYYLKINTISGQVTKHCYWQLVINTTDRSENDLLEELNTLLDEVIHMYVRCDVPFGAFLSGGIDSSIVTALMAKQLDHPVRTFTIGFKEEQYSELPYATEASHIIHTNHYEKIVTPQLADDVLKTIVRHFGEPFGDSSAIPTYFVAREAAEQVKMVLSGDGGDELFGGYNSYRTTFYDLSRPGKNLSANILGFLGRRKMIQCVRKKIQAKLITPYQQKYDAQRQAFNDVGLKDMLLTELPNVPITMFNVDVQSHFIDPVTWFQAQDFKTYMVDDVLTKVDRMSMANSLEVRVPLLDHKLIEFAFTLPLAYKLRYNDITRQLETKYILKKSAERFYSTNFLNRQKRGFGIPLVEWCKGSFRPFIEEGLRKAQNPLFNWIKYDSTQTLLNNFYSGNDNRIAQLWCIFILQLWMNDIHAIK